MQESAHTHTHREADILPVTLGGRKLDFKREGDAQSRIWERMCPFKSCWPDLNRGKECSEALTKPDAPDYSHLHTCSLLPPLNPRGPYVTSQMEARSGQPPSLTPFNVVWLRAPCLGPNRLNFLSATPYMLGRPFPHPPPPPPSSITPAIHTHTHTKGKHHMGINLLSLLYILYR